MTTPTKIEEEEDYKEISLLDMDPLRLTNAKKVVPMRFHSMLEKIQRTGVHRVDPKWKKRLEDARLMVWLLFFLGIIIVVTAVRRCHTRPQDSRPLIPADALYCRAAFGGAWGLSVVLFVCYYLAIKCKARCIHNYARQQWILWGYYQTVALLLNAAEALTGLFSFSNNAMVFLVVFVYALGRLSLTKSFSCTCMIFLVYELSAVPFMIANDYMNTTWGAHCLYPPTGYSDYSARRRLNQFAPLFGFSFAAAIPLYYNEKIALKNIIMKMVWDSGSRKLKRQCKLKRQLLDNILPPDIRRQLTLNPGQTIADEFENCTIMFASFSGIDDLERTLTTVETISILNELWCQLDTLSLYVISAA